MEWNGKDDHQASEKGKSDGLQKLEGYMRIKEHLNSTLDVDQAGFRAESCIDHINILRVAIEQCVEFRSPLHLLFIDFEKAFDSLNRDTNWSALRRRGIPQKLIAIIKARYECSKCHVLHNGKVLEDFEGQSWVHQGCILSPLLFLVIISDVLRAALTEGNNEI